MRKAFAISYRLRKTYRTNGIIFSLKSLPLIKKLLPASLYSSIGLKRFAGVIGTIIEVINTFAYKALYVGFCIFALTLEATQTAEAFIQILIPLTIAGALINTKMFEPTQDKYYALVIMRMDARSYTISNYVYSLIKVVIGFLPFTLIFGLMAGVPVIVCILLPFFIISVKIVLATVTLRFAFSPNKVKNVGELLPVPVQIGIVIFLCAAAYVPFFLEFRLPLWVCYIVLPLFFIAAVPCFRYIWRYDNYRGVYRQLLKTENFQLDKSAQAKAQQTAVQKKLDTDATITSNKSGYKFFNELFIKRHSKLLTKSAIRVTLVLLAIAPVLLIASMLNESMGAAVSELLLNNLPVFLFIMYFLNRGQIITQAMFMNCDHSMLAYRFYRQPKVILSLFSQRLKGVVLINLVPASVFAIFLPLMLWATGGTAQPINYFLLPLSITAMSVFFSVHHMAIYYLLQPYNVELEMKTATYTVVNIVTYVVCYLAMQFSLPTLYFGIGISAFCIIYAAVATLLVYKLAPRTFKLR